MINDTCDLVLFNIFIYDFKSAYSTILKKIDWDFGSVDLNNKLQRNIYLGKLQKENNKIFTYLYTTTCSLIKFFLLENNIQEDEIIVNQLDGVILKRKINNKKLDIELSLRFIDDIFIITPDRKKYISISENNLMVKGISNYYNNLDLYYKKFLKFNYCNKDILSNNLQNFKNSFLNEVDKELFLIKINDKNIIQTVDNEQIIINNIDYFNINLVNKIKYFNHYYKEFIDSIFLMYMV